MPWGNKLLRTNYSLNLDKNALEEDIPLTSIDNVYTLLIPTKNVPNNLCQYTYLSLNNMECHINGEYFNS